MKKLTMILVTAVLGVFLIAGSSWATPYNIRPVTPGDSDLQDFFDTKITGESYDAKDDQSSAAIFTATGVGSVTSYVFSATPGSLYEEGDIFGLYSYANPNILVPIFNLNTISTVTNASTTVYFGDFDGDGNVDDVQVGGLAGIVGEYLDFGADVFGYYTTVDDSTHYTEDDKNGNEEAWALTYQGHGGVLNLPGSATIDFNQNYWMTCFESFSESDTGKDYDDLIIVAESIQPSPVPEPATIFLFGAGLLGLAAIGRKKYGKK